MKISGDRGLSMNNSGVSVPLLIAIANANAFCYQTSDRSLETVDARAWIDVTGQAAAKCVEVSSATCEPSAGDPQIHDHLELRWGELNVVRLPIADP